MIEHITWLDLVGCAAVVALVYAGLRLYVAWWIGSGRAVRTAARIRYGYTDPVASTGQDAAPLDLGSKGQTPVGGFGLSVGAAVGDPGA